MTRAAQRPRALVYADGRYHCADGKTAHGLVRYSQRFDVVCVVDSTLPERDAGELLDGNPRGIPLYNDLGRAVAATTPDTFIVGAVSEGGVLPPGYSRAVRWALQHGLDVVSGLHQFLSDNLSFVKLAQQNGCTITDVRKMFRDYRRFYTGEIREVDATRIAILGSDSAIGKRTLAVMLVNALHKQGTTADMIYTGQTGWMQGWPHGVVIDAMVNDFVAGGIEGAILASWRDDQPELMVLEGQGSLVHPFFPGGYEILTAGQVHGSLLVHAPGRPNLDGFPGYPLPDTRRIVTIAEALTEKPVLGISLNTEKLTADAVIQAKRELHDLHHVPVVDSFTDGVDALVEQIAAIREDQ
ncbi:MAG: DUF1611 domain-containing protein [Thermoplasmatota archaeon]